VFPVNLFVLVESRKFDLNTEFLLILTNKESHPFPGGHFRVYLKAPQKSLPVVERFFSHNQ